MQSDAVKSITCDGNTDYLPIKGDPLSINHALSVIFYTDYDTLSYKFSSTFRQLHDKETDLEIKNRKYKKTYH